MKIIPTSEAKASSVNLVKYLRIISALIISTPTQLQVYTNEPSIELTIWLLFWKMNDIWESICGLNFTDLTIAEPSTATMTMQNRADQSPIQSLMVR